MAFCFFFTMLSIMLDICFRKFELISNWNYCLSLYLSGEDFHANNFACLRGEIDCCPAKCIVFLLIFLMLSDFSLRRTHQSQWPRNTCHGCILFNFSMQFLPIITYLLKLLFVLNYLKYLLNTAFNIAVFLSAKEIFKYSF